MSPQILLPRGTDGRGQRYALYSVSQKPERALLVCVWAGIAWLYRKQHSLYLNSGSLDPGPMDWTLPSYFISQVLNIDLGGRYGSLKFQC